VPSPAVRKISPGCSPDQVMFHWRRSGTLCVLAGRSPEPLSQARSAPVIAPSFPVHGPSSGEAASVWPSSSPALVHHGAAPSLPSRRDVALEQRPAFFLPCSGRRSSLAGTAPVRRRRCTGNGCGLSPARCLGRHRPCRRKTCRCARPLGWRERVRRSTGTNSPGACRSGRHSGPPGSCSRGRSHRSRPVRRPCGDRCRTWRSTDRSRPAAGPGSAR